MATTRSQEQKLWEIGKVNILNFGNSKWLAILEILEVCSCEN
jgi:hypothetical protein